MLQPYLCTREDMGSLNQSQDLKITLLSYSTVHPCEPTKKRSMFLSNLDKLLNFNWETVQFFPSNPDFPLGAVVGRLRSALEKLLVSYDFVAGRLRSDDEGRLEIDCNNAGVGLVIASSELELDELGELHPKLAFRQLTPVGLENQPLLAFQVTSFKCGGYTLGMSMNHVLMDGFSTQIFFMNLATLASNKPLAIPPFTDRRLLAARSPPRVTFPHPELVKSHSSFISSNEGLIFKIFHLSPNQVMFLKNEATMVEKPSSFNVVVAHIWRCRALANHYITDQGENENKTWTLLYAVDVRKRTQPPLPSSYTGNAILNAHAIATCRELESLHLSRIVELVSGGAERMSDEYIRSAIDCVELYQGFPKGDLVISSLWRLGFGDSEFEWGMPKSFCTLPLLGRDVAMLYPGDDAGVNIMIGFPGDDVSEKFSELLYEVFVDPLRPRI